jgi:hypothetical protein
MLRRLFQLESEASVKKVLSGAYWRAEKIVPAVAGALKR